MPSKVTVYKSGGKEKLFSCCLNSYGKCPKCSTCATCKGKTKSGSPCKMKACLDSEYCYHHLKSSYNVVISASRIKNAGLGLFCMTSKNIGQTERDNKQPPVFKKGDFVAPYGGKEMKQSRLNRLYDYTVNGTKIETTAPYGIQSERDGYVIDGLCLRRVGAYINDAKGSKYKPNTIITPDGMYATRNIFKGDEILTSYGEEYWANEHTLSYKTQKIRASKSVPKIGERGRYILAKSNK